MKQQKNLFSFPPKKDLNPQTTQNSHIADMLLHILFTICDGLSVGSSTTSTISAPRGSSSTSDTLAAGNGGGGGGAATISAGTDVTRFNGLVLFSLPVVVVGAVDFGGDECLALNFGFSISAAAVSSAVVVDGGDCLCCGCGCWSFLSI